MIMYAAMRAACMLGDLSAYLGDSSCVLLHPPAGCQHVQTALTVCQTQAASLIFVSEGLQQHTVR